MTQHNRWSKVATLLVLILGSVGLVALMVYTVANVITRTVWNTTLGASSEISALWIMIPLGFAGIAVTQFRKDHIEVTLLVQASSERNRKVYSVISGITMLVTLCMLTYAAYGSATRNLAVGETGDDTGWTIWPLRYVVVIMLAVAAVTTVVQLFQSHDSRDTHDDLLELAEAGGGL